MMRKVCLVGLLAALLLAGCSSGSASQGAGPSSTTPVPATSIVAAAPTPPTVIPESENDPSTSTTSKSVDPIKRTCELTSDRDVIYWEQDEDSEPYALILGGVDSLHCTSTIDSIADTAPVGITYCILVAYADDNPGYDADAKPAARPKNVQNQAGPGC